MTSCSTEADSLLMLKECCCGCSLRTGSMIIGFLTLVAASILTMVAANALLQDNSRVNDKYSSLDTVMESLNLTVRLLQAVASLLLIVATHRPRAGLVLPWLVIAFGVVIVEGISFTVMLSHLAIGKYNPRIFSLGTHVCVTIYFFFVVLSYYRELKNSFPPQIMKA